MILRPADQDTSWLYVQLLARYFYALKMASIKETKHFIETNTLLCIYVLLKLIFISYDVMQNISLKINRIA